VAAAEAAHPGNSPEVVEALIRLIDVETMESKVSDATMETADRALRVAEAIGGRESSLYAKVLAAKARVFRTMDRPEFARPLAEEAVVIEKRIDSDPQGLSDTAAELGYICQADRDNACAVKYGELQVDTLRGMKNVDPQTMASALVALQYARRHAGDMAGAKAATDEAMALAEHAETATPEWAIIESWAGGFYAAAEEYGKALQHMQRGLELNIEINGTGNLAQASLVANLAYVEMCLGKTAEALQYYAQARELYARLYGPAQTQTMRIDDGYGYALTFLGKTEEAMDTELRAHSLERERVGLAIRLMPERQALSMANSALVSYNLLVSMSIHHPQLKTSDLYQEVVRSRALVAEEMAQREAALNRKNDSSIQALEQELEKERKTVLELQGTPADAHTSSALDDANARMEQTERELARRSAAFRAEERGKSSDLNDLRKNIPAGSVLISYVSYSLYNEKAGNFAKLPVPSYMAFVLHRDSNRIGVYPLGEANAIVEDVRRMRASADAEAHGGGLGAARNEREYRAAGLELRKRVWDPLKAELDNARLVLVVPDGVLNLVPFGALPDGDGYLVEHGPVVHILSSERDLLPANSEQKKSGLLAIGSPSFQLTKLDAPQGGLREGPANCEDLSKMQFNALPGSLSEVNDISSTWKRWNGLEPEELLTGEDATRAKFLEAAPRSRILHIATHAFVLNKNCGNGNPLLTSGLVFAGANNSRDASVLTAEQIASIDLNGVDWAVLSACNTGYGELKDGEGVLGLERAFRVAGARSVVMTLWPVDDQTTRNFMRHLYAERFARHSTTADSLWIADRSMLKERRAAGKSTHPWYWAGFIGAGAWE
jgi:CHAT domain-containing protein